MWVNVYEKAVGLVRVEKAKADGMGNASLIDLLAKGGSAGTTIELVTGNPIVRFSCKYAKEEGLTEKERAAKLDELRKLLTSAFDEKRLVTCGTASGVTTPGVNGTTPTPSGYDAKTDEIALWNPHGQTFTPKGAPGLQLRLPDEGRPVPRAAGGVRPHLRGRCVRDSEARKVTTGWRERRGNEKRRREHPISRRRVPHPRGGPEYTFSTQLAAQTTRSKHFAVIVTIAGSAGETRPADRTGHDRKLSWSCNTGRGIPARCVRGVYFSS